MCSLEEFSQAEYNLSHEIFVGQIVNESYDSDIDRYLLEFNVLESYKGESSPSVIVQRQNGKRSISSCEFNGKVGDIYLIVISLKQKYYDVSYCTRKTKISSMNEYIIPEWFSPFFGITDGWHKNYHPNNTVESEGRIVKGKAEGKWQFYNNEGSLIQKGEYLNGKIDGEWISYFSNGQVQAIENFKEGLHNGKHIIFHSVNGTKANEYNYLNNQFHGNSKAWFPTGTLAWETEYEMDSLIDIVYYDWDGVKWEGEDVYVSVEYGYGGVHEVVKNVAFPIRTRIWNSDSVLTDIWVKGTPVFQKNSEGEVNLDKGQGFYRTTQQFGEVKDSLKTGVWQIIDFKGEVEKKTYEKGVLNGFYQKVSANGFLIEEGSYTDGVKLGIWKRYYIDGQIMEEVEISYFGGEKLLNTFSPEGKQMIINGDGIQYHYSKEGLLFSDMRFRYKDGGFKRSLKWREP